MAICWNYAQFSPKPQLVTGDKQPKILEASHFRPEFRKNLVSYAPLTHGHPKSPFLGDFKKVYKGIFRSLKGTFDGSSPATRRCRGYSKTLAGGAAGAYQGHAPRDIWSRHPQQRLILGAVGVVGGRSVLSTGGSQTCSS